MANPKSDIEKMINKLDKIKEELSSKKNMEDLGNEAVRLIRKRTLLGFSVSKQGGGKSKLKKLSDPYKKQRKNMNLSGKTTKGKSNLTQTGDMLDDLSVVSVKDGKTEIGFDSKKSKDKAKWVSETRPFNNLSKSEIKQLSQSLNEQAKKIKE